MIIAGSAQESAKFEGGSSYNMAWGKLPSVCGMKIAIALLFAGKFLWCLKECPCEAKESGTSWPLKYQTKRTEAKRNKSNARVELTRGDDERKDGGLRRIGKIERAIADLKKRPRRLCRESRKEPIANGFQNSQLVGQCNYITYYV